jgi:LPS-assembly protein
MRFARLRLAALYFFLTAAAASAAAENATPPESKTQALADRAAPKSSGTAPPIYLEADKVQGYQGRNIRATGEVRLRRENVDLHTDELEYLQPSNEVVGHGNVRLERDGDTVRGTRFRYDLDTDEGFVEKPSFSLTKKPGRKFPARGSGALVKFLGANRERISDARYTTCPPGQDDWFLRVRDMELDRVTEIGQARNAIVEFKGLPIFYVPWLSFPLSDKRKSGFLTPTFGTTGRSGFEVEMPYYWNIAPNMDATFAPRLLSKRGLQVFNEVRYLNPTFRGDARADVLPNDRQSDLDRYLLLWRHDHTLPYNWRAHVDLEKVSDDNYFRDLSTRINDTSQTNLPRDVTLAWSDATWNFSAQRLAYQTLQDPTNPTIERPYRLQPQLRLTGLRPNAIYGLDLSLSSEATEFRHPTKTEGRRLIINPEISYPMRTSFAFFVPKAGYHYTRYGLTERFTGEDQIRRSLPVLSLDGGLFFERDMTYRDRPFRQTLEPRLFYVYIPFEDQSQIPNFSTSLLDFNFAQIFTENQFIGGDRVNDANQITAAVTSRFIENANGIERLRIAVGQRYYFERPRVTLTGPNVARDQRASDVLLGLSGQVSDRLTLDGAWQFNPETSRGERSSVGARYIVDRGKVINLAYRSATRAAVPPDGVPEQVDFSIQWPIFQRWYGLGRLNYSLTDSKLLEGLMGLEYNANCWQLRLVAHRIITAEQLVSTSFFVQLELNGLSRFGQNPLEVLKQNIPGYIKSQEISP